ncbi:MAG: trimeric autotransporter adhesin [Acidobacteriota bacterium]|jgi:hypothetical protein|nr:trimeric autotransporter adhesin [Acidobacteriota bacterium]
MARTQKGRASVTYSEIQTLPECSFKGKVSNKMSTPWFFLSYASIGSGSTNDVCVEQFYSDLIEELRTSAQLDESVPATEIGFFAKTGMGDGTVWPEALAESLRMCRVLVCLYSGKYFNSVPCGKEFTIFNSRVDAYAEGPPKRQRPPLILPVIWVVPDDFPRTLPRAVSKIDYKNEYLGNIVKAGGLYYYLKSRAKYKDEYDAFVSHLAKKIKAVASKPVLSELAEVRPFEQIDSAFHTRIQPPVAPSGLLAEAVSPSQIRLTWTDNSPDEEGFRIERRQGAGSTDFVQIRQVGSDINNFLNTGLAPQTSYTYRVRAFNEGGESDYSNEATATTHKQHLRIPLYLIVAASVIVITAILFRWGILPPSRRQTPTPTPTPKIETEAWSDTFDRMLDKGQYVWIKRDEWDIAEGQWETAPEADDSKMKEHGVLVVKGQAPGVVRDKVFDNFVARFTVSYMQGTRAGWLLRAGGPQPGGRSGYYFVLEKQEGRFYLSAKAVGKTMNKMSPPACLIDITQYQKPDDYIMVKVIASENVFDYRFTLENPTQDDERDIIQHPKEVGCAIKDDGAEYFHFGQIGFFADDDVTAFRVEKLVVEPSAVHN